ncbi:MAG: hypothetical protein ACW96M_05165, partial [Candidatus Thorarchaeota archaeon]
MFGMIEESRVAFLKQWRNYIVLLFIILLIPYRWVVPRTTESPWLVVEGLFYTLTLSADYLFQVRSIYLLSVMNLILLIIPSIYFTYRNISNNENESMERLGLVTILLTMVVLAIINLTSYTSHLQYDIAHSPTPNFQYLPGFSLLLIFFTIMVPIFTNYINSQKQISHPFVTGIIGRTKEQLPKTPGGWLSALLFLLPSGLLISLPSSSFFDFESNLIFDVIGSFYTGTLDIMRFDQFTDFSGNIIFGGIVTLFNLLLSLLWGIILVAFVLLYLQEKIHRRLLIVGGLLSIGPHLILLFSSFYSVIMGGFPVGIYVPLPLLQICVILIIRSEKQMKG